MIRDGNSIFIFEVAGLCIGHLGHLHHKLDDSHFAQIGRLDILMVPIDGTYTMSLDGISEITSGCAPRWCCRCTASPPRSTNSCSGSASSSRSTGAASAP